MFVKDLIKQFLKLDWRKGLIFLFLMFILPLPFHPYCPSFVEHRGLELEIIPYPCQNVEFLTAIQFFITTSKTQIYQAGFSLEVLVSGVIIGYLISCLLISAWDKTRKKSVI